MTRYKALGKLIKANREEIGLYQFELAEKLKIGQQTISRWEKGDSRPRLNDLKKLLDLFKVTFRELWINKAGYNIGNWIDARKLKPEIKHPILIYVEDWGHVVGFRLEDDTYRTYFHEPGVGTMYLSEIKYWMPLPEPPIKK